MFNVSGSLGIALLTRLRLGLSHKFQDTINLLCPCTLESEETTYFFLRCQKFTDLRKYFINELIKTNSCILRLDETTFTKLLLYGDNRYGYKRSKSVILASINFIHSSKCFGGQLM